MAVQYGDDDEENLGFDEFETPDDISDTPHRSSPLPPTGYASSINGGIAVNTTEQGLPTEIRIEAAEMSKPASTLAADILRLCQLAGMRAAATRRSQLTANGMTEEALSYLRLPTPDDVARHEALYEEEASGETIMWQR